MKTSEESVNNLTPNVTSNALESIMHTASIQYFIIEMPIFLFELKTNL